MGFLLWIIIGGIAGWIASMIMKTDAQQGVLLNILVGIVGGLVGGWVLGLFGFQPEGPPPSGGERATAAIERISARPLRLGNPLDGLGPIPRIGALVIDAVLRISADN